MPSVAIIAEGITDQRVLENILVGFFDSEESTVVNFVQPPVEEPGFGVRRRADDGRELGVDELIEGVRQRLAGALGADFCTKHGRRVALAIAVNSIECWLLPLLYEDEPAKAGKTTGCLEAVDSKLRRLNQPTLRKDPLAYEKASRPYVKRRTLMTARGRNPSLDVFLRSLEALARDQPEGAAKGAEAVEA